MPVYKETKYVFSVTVCWKQHFDLNSNYFLNFFQINTGQNWTITTVYRTVRSHSTILALSFISSLTYSVYFWKKSLHFKKFSLWFMTDWEITSLFTWCEKTHIISVSILIKISCVKGILYKGTTLLLMLLYF